MIRLLLAAVLLVSLSACAALNRADTPATLRAESAAYSTESAGLATLQSDQAALGSARVASLSTQSAFTSGVNAQLAGTLGAVITPTAPLQNFGDALGSFNVTPLPGEPIYRLSGVTDFVNESNGCIIGQRAVFDDSFPYVTITLVAYSLPRDTVFRAEWFYEGDLKASDSWVADADYPEVCLWFRLEQARTAFTLGRWSVRVFADDTQIGVPLDFEMAATAPNTRRR